MLTQLAAAVEIFRDHARNKEGESAEAVYRRVRAADRFRAGIKALARDAKVKTVVARDVRCLEMHAASVARRAVSEAVQRVVSPPGGNVLHQEISALQRAPSSLEPCSVVAIVCNRMPLELVSHVLPTFAIRDYTSVTPAHYRQDVVLVVVERNKGKNDASIHWDQATVMYDVEDMLATSNGAEDAVHLANRLAPLVPFRLLNARGESLDDNDLVVEVGLTQYAMPAAACPVWPIVVWSDDAEAHPLFETDDDGCVYHTVTTLHLRSGETWAVDCNGERYGRVGLPLLSRLPLTTGVPAGCKRLVHARYKTMTTLFE